MKDFSRNNPRFSLCGLNCRLCPMNISGHCGGCGFAGCRALAEACVKAESIQGLSCPVGGDSVMEQVAAILVPAAESEAPKEAASAGAFTPQRAVALGAPDVLVSDPKCAEAIKALPTPRAAFPNLLAHLA